MTTLAAAPSPFEVLLDNLTPDSGLALRRWTPDELRRLVLSEIFSAGETLTLANGEIVDCDTRLPRLFSRGEYYNLTNFGLLGPEERTELIYGRIITRMSPIGQPHSIAVSKTSSAVEEAFGAAFFTEQQMPLHVGRGLEPEPDVMVLAGRPDDHPDVPRPADVLLLVEVSFSTLGYGRSTKNVSQNSPRPPILGVQEQSFPLRFPHYWGLGGLVASFEIDSKATLYAENGLAEYWIINLRARTLEVYRQPEGDTYISLRVYDETEAVAPPAASRSLVRVADLLPLVRG